VYIFSGGVNEYLNPESGKGEELTNHVFNQPQIDYIEREGVNVRYSNLIIHPTILYRPLKKRLLWSSGSVGYVRRNLYVYENS
jgi:hypothetical protein